MISSVEFREQSNAIRLETHHEPLVLHLLQSENSKVDLKLFAEILLGLLLMAVLFGVWCDQRYSRRILLPKISEKPMFMALRVTPCEDGESVKFSTRDGKLLRGVYVRTTAPKRAGILIFSHEFLADRWSFQVYAEGVREAGFDIFSFDFRNHGESDEDPTHPSLQWLTDREYIDLEAALDYVRSRPDHDETGVALFGVSRGGSVSLAMAAKRTDVWGVITDSAFPTVGTLVPYMIRFATLYVKMGTIVEKFPSFVFRFIGYRGISKAEKKYGCRFLHLESLVGKISPRPWLAIHGQSDNYITTDVAERLFNLASQPKEMWVVSKAKHNRSQQIEPEEYRRRITEFLCSNAPSRQASMTDSNYKRMTQPESSGDRLIQTANS
ncbi:MAG: alpha/beta hydrolase [Planctomycetota bacterium]|nr:alpha/beta hydrolase [Planctomycetota bacterium]